MCRELASAEDTLIRTVKMVMSIMFKEMQDVRQNIICSPLEDAELSLLQRKPAQVVTVRNNLYV